MMQFTAEPSTTFNKSFKLLSNNAENLYPSDNILLKEASLLLFFTLKLILNGLLFITELCFTMFKSDVLFNFSSSTTRLPSFTSIFVCDEGKISPDGPNVTAPLS